MTTFDAILWGLLVGVALAMAWAVAVSWLVLHRMKVNR